MATTISTYILVIIILIGLFIAIFRGILPKIATEPTTTPAAKAWLNLWLPLLATLPLLLTLTFTRSINPSQPLIWFAAGPATAITALILGLIFLIDHSPFKPSHNRPRWGHSDGFLLRHSLLLTLIGAMLAIASLSDRITLPHGEACLFAAVLWIWMNSPASNETERGRSNQSSQKKPKVVLDWAGTLHRPVTAVIKGAIFFGLILLAQVMHYLLRSELEGTAVLTAVFQGALALAVWLVVGRGAAQKFLLSTLIFSILLGTGLLAVTRLHTNVYLPFWPSSWNIMGPSVFLGMSSLSATAIFILGIALVTFLYAPISHSPINIDDNQDSIRKISILETLTGTLLISGAIIIALTGSQEFLREAGGFVYHLIIG